MSHTPPATRYRILSDRSTVVLSSRSTMGPITFQTRSVSGEIEAVVVDGRVMTDPGPTATLEVRLDELESGNELYDAELRRRIDARTYPTCRVDLVHTHLLSGRRFALTGEVNFHDITRTVEGSVEVEAPEKRLLIIGDKTIDIRDFELPTPSILLLKIYPDVRVQMFLEARADDGEANR